MNVNKSSERNGILKKQTKTYYGEDTEFMSQLSQTKSGFMKLNRSSTVAMNNTAGNWKTKRSRMEIYNM